MHHIFSIESVLNGNLSLELRKENGQVIKDRTDKKEGVV